jgi:hypothetical protein
MRKPSGVRRAMVSGRPPRAGVPSAGSTRSTLIRWPLSAAARPTRSRNASENPSSSANRRWCSNCMANTSAVDAHAPPTAATASAARPRPAPPPPWRVGTVRPRSPARCSDKRLSCGKLASRSCDPATAPISLNTVAGTGAGVWCKSMTTSSPPGQAAQAPRAAARAAADRRGGAATADRLAVRRARARGGR